MATYGATFDIAQPEKFNRVHIAIRLLVLIVLAALAGSLGWLHGAVFLGVPVAAAILISQKGAARYLAEAEQDMAKLVRYIVAFYAYMGLLTDRFPNLDPRETLHFEVASSGSPTAGSALLRIIMAIPSALVLALLSIVSGLLLVIAAIFVLIQESYPEGIYSFQRGVLRWMARLLGYTASLVQDYPPFALDTGSEGGAPVPPGGEQPEAGPAGT